MRHSQRRNSVLLFLAAIVGGLLLLGQVAHAAYGFTPYGALNTNAATDKGQDYYPVVATDGAGTWIAVWQSNGKPSSAIGDEGDIFYAVSTDNGATWSDQETLNTNATTDTMQDPEPVIASGGNGHWIVVWASQENLNGTIGTDWDILYSVSPDDGETWSAPAALNTNAADDFNTDQSPSIACDGNGHWTVVWLTYDTLGGTIGNDGDVIVSRSSNNGATWSAPAALNTNAATDTAADLFPHIATDKAGMWVTVWQVQENLDSDVVCARSIDNGATWSATNWIGDDTLPDNSDEGSAKVATDYNGTWIAFWTNWNDSGGVYKTNIESSMSTDDGESWSFPVQITTDGENGTNNEFPNVAADAAGTWMVVWKAWRGLGNTLGKDEDILVTLSEDNGLSWAPPRALKLNAPKDDGNDWTPQIATDGGGHWVVVWESKDTLGDTIGKDSDIFISTTVYPQPIQVLKPNGGETYVRGVKKKMTWSTTLDPGTFVQIEVWRNGSFVHRVDKSTPNDGVYKLKFPPDAEPGGGYTMRVILKSDPSVYDESDAPFKVK